MPTTRNATGTLISLDRQATPYRSMTPRTTKATARAVGLLFITGTAAGSLSSVALTPLINAPDVLRAVATDPDRALLGALLILVMGFALALIPLVAYPVLRAESEPLALGYVVFRGGLETACYLALALVWLLVISIGRDYAAVAGPAAGQLETIVEITIAGYDLVAHVLLTIVFALGALMFCCVLFRARLVPRWLSGWGLVGALLWLSAGILAVVGLVDPRSPAQIAMNIPIAVQEMVLAGWLIIKGFDGAAIDPGPRSTEPAAVTG